MKKNPLPDGEGYMNAKYGDRFEAFQRELDLGDGGDLDRHLKQGASQMY